MNVAYDILHTVLSKLTLDLFIGVMIMWVLSFITKTKGYVFLIYLSVKLNLGRIFTFLFSRILHHKIYASLKVLKERGFLRYIINSDYRDYMSLISEITYKQINFILKSFEGTIAIDMFYLSREEFVMLLVQLTIEGQTETSHSIRELVRDGKIDNKFSKKYLTWVENVYDGLRKRVSDIGGQPNNYYAYIKFLYILNDYIESYMNTVAPSINMMNGDVKANIQLNEDDRVLAEAVIKRFVEIVDRDIKTRIDNASRKTKKSN